MIVKPVIEHTTIVSIKVWVMDTSPWPAHRVARRRGCPAKICPSLLRNEIKSHLHELR